MILLKVSSFLISEIPSFFMMKVFVFLTIAVMLMGLYQYLFSEVLLEFTIQRSQRSFNIYMYHQTSNQLNIK